MTIAPQLIYTPTNQAYPMSEEYNELLSVNARGYITLNNVNDYHRIGERIHDLTVKVNSQSSVSFVSGTWQGNSRSDLENGYDTESVQRRGVPSLIVCCMNLEYYLVENLGGDMGASNYSEHQKQRAKVSKALGVQKRLMKPGIANSMKCSPVRPKR